MKNKQLSKILPFIIPILLVMIVLLVACSDKNGNSVSTTTDSAGISESETEQEKFPLPDVTYDGKTFTILSRNQASKTMHCELDEGTDEKDAVSSALYDRDIKISEKFKVDLDYTFISDAWAELGDYLGYVRQGILSGDESFQLVDGAAAYIAGLETEDLFYNLKESDYINFEAPWWFNDFSETFTVNGQLYFISGDLSLLSWKVMDAVIFNKELANQHNFGDMYSIVREGNWTLDKLEELAKNSYSDLNTNGKKDWGDLFGFVTINSNNIDAVTSCFDAPIILKQEDGTLIYNLDNPQFESISSRLFELLTNNNGIYFAPETLTISKEVVDAFKDNLIIMTEQTFGSLELLRSMDIDFGIIPYPKFNDAQKEYKSVMLGVYSLMAIPSTLSDFDFAAIITDAMCRETSQIVVPEYYDRLLKGIITRDDDSKEMIDIIRKGISFDVGVAYSVYMINPQTGVGPANLLRMVYRNNSSNIASEWQKYKESYEIKLSEILEFYQN